VTENDGLTFAPVFVEDLRSVFGSNCIHRFVLIRVCSNCGIHLVRPDTAPIQAKAFDRPGGVCHCFRIGLHGGESTAFNHIFNVHYFLHKIRIDKQNTKIGLSKPMRISPYVHKRTRMACLDFLFGFAFDWQIH
jgi:hypothetical protein